MSLERKKPMRRTGFVSRPREVKPSPRRRKDTGPTQTTRDMVWTRAGGRCEVCGGSLAGVTGFSVHHRHPRRMGGSRRPELNTAANLLVVCGSGTTGCHGRIESNRERAHEDGLLLHDGESPERVPVMIPNPLDPSQWPRLVWLTVDGTYTEEPPV